MLTKTALHYNEKHHHNHQNQKHLQINVRGCQWFLVQTVLVPKAASLEYEFRKQSLRHWNLDITIELLGITNYFLYPSHSKIDEKEPQYSEQILPAPSPFVKSRFRCITFEGEGNKRTSHSQLLQWFTYSIAVLVRSS